ncbi:MAG TPA: succinate dehydrogenase assembly factor 2 [Wenzhouxiangellaceae bacterium]|nr:succinate dehydrogenase assembly factor 2 [Wenzhouxiangellaceae bacterium]
MGRSSPDPDHAALSRLRWRCRRGMRELDTLLERWLTERWRGADASDRITFERLLGCEDDQLWDWCMGRSTPDDPVLAAMVEQVVEPTATRDRDGLGG